MTYEIFFTKYNGVSVSELYYPNPHPCLDTEAPRYPNFDSSHPNLDTETHPLVVRYRNNLYPN